MKKIQQPTNKPPVFARISQDWTVHLAELVILFERSSSRLATKISRVCDNVQCVLSLRKKYPLWTAAYFNAEKIFEFSHILHRETFAQVMFKLLYHTTVITTDK